MLLPLVGLLFAGAPREYWYLHRSLDSLPPPETLFSGPCPHPRAGLAHGHVRLRLRRAAPQSRPTSRQNVEPRANELIVPPPSRPCDAVDGGRGLGSGRPASPGTVHLELLPSGSDPVRGVPPRRTRPSTSRVHHLPVSRGPSGGEFSPAWRGFRVQGTPSAPPITIDDKGRRPPTIYDFDGLRPCYLASAVSARFGPNFGKLFAAALLQEMSFFLLVHVPGYLETLGVTEALIGLLYAAGAVLALLFRPAFGRILDLTNRRTVLLVAGLLERNGRACPGHHHRLGPVSLGALPCATRAADRPLHHHAHLRCGFDAGRASHPGAGSVRSLRAPPHRTRGCRRRSRHRGLRIPGPVRAGLGGEPRLMVIGVASAVAPDPWPSSPTWLLVGPGPTQPPSFVVGDARIEHRHGDGLHLHQDLRRRSGGRLHGSLLRRVRRDRSRHENPRRAALRPDTTASIRHRRLAGLRIGSTAAGRSGKLRSRSSRPPSRPVCPMASCSRFSPARW